MIKSWVPNFYFIDHTSTKVFFLNYQFSIDVNCVQILGKEIEDIKVLPGGGFLVETDEGTSESGPGELGWPG